LKNSGVIPVYTSSISTKLSDAIKGYLQLVVNLRNTISHTYKMEIDEQFNSKQMRLLIHLFKCTIKIIEDHIKNEISKKYIESFNKEPVISVSNVIRGCNASGSQEAILEINVTDQTIDPYIKQLVIKSNTNIGYCTITGIKVGHFNLKKLPLNKTCTVSVVSTIKIRNGYQYELCQSLHKSTRNLNIIQHI
jgi:hypothetical protein